MIRREWTLCKASRELSALTKIQEYPISFLRVSFLLSVAYTHYYMLCLTKRHVLDNTINVCRTLCYIRLSGRKASIRSCYCSYFLDSILTPPVTGYAILTLAFVVEG